MRTLVFSMLLSAVPALAAGKFSLTSTELKPNTAMPMKQVFDGMGCGGENLSPQLAWTDAPKDTKSFVLTVYDPDAPTGSGWWHWVVYNIPATATELPAGAGSGKAELPAGAVAGPTDFFGKTNYGGACPPPGDKPHRYIFTLHALKVDKLDVPEGSTAAYIGFMTGFNTISKATFTVTYSRKK